MNENERKKGKKEIKVPCHVSNVLSNNTFSGGLNLITGPNFMKYMSKCLK